MLTSGSYGPPVNFPKFCHMIYPLTQILPIPVVLGPDGLQTTPSNLGNSEWCVPGCPTFYYSVSPQVPHPVTNPSTQECWRAPWSCLTQPATTFNSQENQLKLQITEMGPHSPHRICSQIQFSCMVVSIMAQLNISCSCVWNIRLSNWDTVFHILFISASCYDI